MLIGVDRRVSAARSDLDQCLHSFQLAAGGEDIQASRFAEEAREGAADDLLKGRDSGWFWSLEWNSGAGIQRNQVYFRIQTSQ